MRQHADNAALASESLSSLEAKLHQMVGMLQRASEIAVRAGDRTLNAADRVAMAEEVDGILEDLVRIGNGRENGYFLFGGLRGDVLPYEVTRGADGRIESVTYQGNTGIRSVEVGKGVTLPVSLPGSTTGAEGGLFQTASLDLFADLTQLRNQLLSGDNVADDERFVLDPASDTLSVSGTYETGSLVRVSTTGTLPAGLSADQPYYSHRSVRW